MVLIRNTDRLPTMFDRVFETDWRNWPEMNYSPASTTLPRVNIGENNDEYRIEVAAPGMKRDDFRINYDNGKLVISSDFNETVDEGERYTLREFSYQSFQRTFNISREMVDGEKLKASYEDGILTIILPKRDEIKPRPPREISIS
ncbi:MAG: Hsp20/alpha crystallin family protein [Bacteroidetes bacterium]|nr:MAG: Hsp20/alpha crystallin family protein [Bacteroidota bacterium]